MTFLYSPRPPFASPIPVSQMPPTPATSRDSTEDWQIDGLNLDQQQPGLHAPQSQDIRTALSISQDHSRFTMPTYASHEALSLPWNQSYFAPDLNASSSDFGQNVWDESCESYYTGMLTMPWNPSRVAEIPLAVEGQQFGRLSEYSVSPLLSSWSSPYARSEGYMPSVSTPFIKTEEASDWFDGGQHVMTDLALAEDSPSYSSTVEMPESSPKQQPRNVETYLSPRKILRPVRIKAEDDVDGRPTARRALSSDDYRLSERHKRGYTQLEDAVCACPMCGRLFQRSYNLKAHLETHDPNRIFPNECDYEGCAKRFKRKTDLLRHQQSVGRLLDFAIGSC